MDLEVAVCLPQEADTVAVVRRVVAGALTTLGVTRQCVDEIRLAVSEACTNVLEHAASEDEYELRLHVDGHRATITVTDGGEELDASELTGVMPDASSPRGRGLAIMRAVMDSVDFSWEPERGTIVRFVKTLAVHEGAPLDRLRRRVDPGSTPGG